MPHFVYILQSLKDGKYYIGETSDLNARLDFHNGGRQRSTRSRIPFKLELVEVFDTRDVALMREKLIKSWKGGEAFRKLLEGT
ncbi:MAG: GIY-YIG nuclease family protein [Pedobacter sp.]|nr:MAG: GIY-YIG nuclease family protein [Pedobacter sp.]